MDILPLLLGEPSESRLRHGISHRFAVEIVGVEVDDVVWWLARVEQLPHVFVIGLRISLTDHTDPIAHRIRKHPIHLRAWDEFEIESSLLAHSVL